MMKPWQVLRTGIAASAIGHLSLLMLVLFSAEVHPFGSVTAEPIAVDLVTPAEAPPPPKKEEPEPKPSDSFDLSATSASPNSPPPAAQPPAAQAPAAQPTPAQPTPARPPQQKQQQAALPTPQPAPQPPSPQQPPAVAPAATNAPPTPEPSNKYPRMVGWPTDMLLKEAREKSGDTGNADPSAKADIAVSAVAAFREHLKTCSKLPASVAPLDGIRIRVRVFMTPGGGLATDPAPLEGPPSQKGIDLTQSAIDALKACQPYPMLPADQYREWKVMDLTFTAQDFSTGS